MIDEQLGANSMERMDQLPDDLFSIVLSMTLDGVGVSEGMVLKRRKMAMILEELLNLDLLFNNVPEQSFVFGSQMEGTTTLGLESDSDYIDIENKFSRVNTDKSMVEPDPSELRLQMIQDEATSPGYCRIWVSSVPISAKNWKNASNLFFVDKQKRYFMRHTIMFTNLSEGEVRHGPAVLIHKGPEFYDRDHVRALKLSGWPKEAHTWIELQHPSGWPPENLKRFCLKQTCFVVPVGSKTNANDDTEWRISYTPAEKLLMFNLNIIQIKCYVLMKMIMKTYIDPKFEGVVSSYICKTVLFHCISSNDASVWTESNLLACLKICLQKLRDCVASETCPHFIVPGNNLLAGKLSVKNQQQLCKKIGQLSKNIFNTLHGLTVDDLGWRLFLNINTNTLIHDGVIKQAGPVDSGKLLAQIANDLNYYLARELHLISKFSLSTLQKQSINKVCQKLEENITRLESMVTGSRNEIRQLAWSLFKPFLCTTMGSIMASRTMGISRTLSAEAYDWFQAGLNSDVSSSRLKLDSALYSTGDLQKVDKNLTDLEEQIGQQSVIAVCTCYQHKHISTTQQFSDQSFWENEKVIERSVAFCVRYLPYEVNCVPKELIYEMFRSKRNELQHRDKLHDCWMDWAVVDSLPYLYFLQYKVYSQLHRQIEKARALENLANVIDTRADLFHRETALNLLAQCMEQEDEKKKAFICYIKSLKIRDRNNVARWHICRMLASEFRKSFQNNA